MSADRAVGAGGALGAGAGGALGAGPGGALGAGAGRRLVRGRALRVVRGGREVISGVDLELAAGEIVALLGPNGAGKSTLLAAVAGGVELSGGTIEVDGRVAVAMQSPDLARRTALGNVELALGWWGVPRGAGRRERALRALAVMGVGELAGRRADSLSGGERRRVHIARALAVESDVLLLDEPFAGLDAEARAGLLADSATVLRSERRATMIVVHDRAEAWALADRVLVLLDGQVAAVGSPRELLAAPPSAAVARFLGYDGWVLQGDQVLLTRPSGVVIDPGGELVGTVTSVLGMEDGARVMVTVGRVDRGAVGGGAIGGSAVGGGAIGGSAIGGATVGGATVGGVLSALVTWPAPELGSEVRVRVTGGVRFAATDAEPPPAGAAS